MHRRQAFYVVTGGVGLLSGCLGQALPIGRSNGLTIEYNGDPSPDERRIVIVMLTESSSTVFSMTTSKNSVELTDETALFYEKYELGPGDTVHPDVFVTEPGSYRLDVWVEGKGTIGGDVEIGEDGSLASSETITITADGISSEQK